MENIVINIDEGRRDPVVIAEIYKLLYTELGTYEKMHAPEDSCQAMAEVDLEYTSGYGEPDVKRLFSICFPAGKSSRKQIIEIRNMRFYTRCEHHGLPFFGFAHYAYIPDESVCGLSKPARMVAHFSKRYQMQEQLATQISEALWDMTKPVAQVLTLEGFHLCSVMRGVRTPDEIVRIREEKVNEELYRAQKREGHLYHLVKDLLAMSLKSDLPTVRFL